MHSTWAGGREFRRHAAGRVLAQAVQAPFVLRVQAISYGRPENLASSGSGIAPRAIGARDRIAMSAVDHFGRGGVASIGYEPGSGRSMVEPHELNAAFSSQPFTFGGVVGGGVSLNF